MNSFIIINSVAIAILGAWIIVLEDKVSKLKEELERELLREIWDIDKETCKRVMAMEARIVAIDKTLRGEIKDAMESLGYTYLHEVTTTLPGKWVKKGAKH